jgi:hypothetical protein
MLNKCHTPPPSPFKVLMMMMMIIIIIKHPRGLDEYRAA